MNPQNVVELLRNTEGLQNKKNGYGNEKALDQLLGHHSVIFQPEDLSNSILTDKILSNWNIELYSTDISHEFMNRIKEYLQSKLRVTPKVEFVSLEELNPIVFNPKNRKPIYLVDKRS